METTAWVIIIVVLLNLGFAFGHWSWRIAHNSSSPRWLRRLLWPVSDGKIFEANQYHNPPVIKLPEAEYKSIMTFVGSFKLAIVILEGVILLALSFLLLLVWSLNIKLNGERVSVWHLFGH